MVNIYILTLDPYGTKIDDVVKYIKDKIRDLDKGCIIYVNGEKYDIYIFSLIFIGDIL